MLHYQRHLLWKLRQAGVEPPPYRCGREEVEEDLDEYLDGVSILMESKEVCIDDMVSDDDSLSDAGPSDSPQWMLEVTQYLLSESGVPEATAARFQRRRAQILDYVFNDEPWSDSDPQ